jgi:RNA polymerase sigma-70 factor (ECF subfamily)
VILSAPSGLHVGVATSDAELVQATVAGDDRAADALALRWGPTVLRWCARLGGPGVDPEDAAADVFERVFNRVATLRDPAAFPPWLFRTARGVVNQHRRRAWLRRWVPGLHVDPADPAAGTGRRYELGETARVVQAALETLPAELREVIVLSDVDERAGSEVAGLLGLPLGTVKSRLRRARERLEAELRARGIDGVTG